MISCLVTAPSIRAADRKQTGLRPGIVRWMGEQAAAPSTADVPNLWQCGAPCTTFCDYQHVPPAQSLVKALAWRTGHTCCSTVLSAAVCCLGLAIRAAFEQWDWRKYLAGQCTIHALSQYQQQVGAVGALPLISVILLASFPSLPPGRGRQAPVPLRPCTKE